MDRPVDARFRWHPSARLVDAAGLSHRAGVAPTGGALDDADPVAALQLAIGADCFRIGAADAPPPVAWAGGGPMLETLSGGTSGLPRRILRTQASWIASFQVNAGIFGIGPAARVATPGRLVHSLALYAACEGLHLGAEVHLLSGKRPDRQAAALAARGITHLYATPAQLRAFPRAPACSGLAHVIVGGARLDAALRGHLARLFPGAAVHEFYGASETSFLTLSDAETPSGSVGAAFPGVELRIDGAGLIWARSPYLALGYAGAAGSALWQDGWVTAGETGRIEAGHLYLSGRAGRVIRVAEHSLHPEEMEVFLMSCSGVQQAAVLPRPDPARGQVPVAVIAGERDAEAAILAALRGAFGPMLAPRSIQWWAEEWPALASGKTDLGALERAMPWR